MDFTGMKPVTITSSGVAAQGIFAGQEQAPISISQSTTASSGTFRLPTPATSDVTFQGKLAGGSYSGPIKADAFPSGGISGTWTCSGPAMSLTVPTPNGPTTLDLARVST